MIRLRSDVESIVALQVRQAWLDLESTRKRIDVNEAALESANENLRVARDRYNEGTVINTVVLDAVTLRTGAYNRYYTSVYDAILASMRLRRAVGEFHLVDLEGVPPESEKPVTLRVEADGKLGGFSGCNRYFGQWTEQDGRVSFGPMGSTRMACPEPAMALETRYLGAMGRVAGRRFEDGDLLLLDESDRSILRFVPVESDDP